MKRLTAAAAFAAGAAVSAPASAQVTLVCQTPYFWCSILAPYPANGEACYCASYAGPVWGYTLIPQPAASYEPPPLPPVRPRYEEQPRARNNPPPRTPPAEAEDCLNGLGNCAGAYSGN